MYMSARGRALLSAFLRHRHIPAAACSCIGQQRQSVIASSPRCHLNTYTNIHVWTSALDTSSVTGGSDQSNSTMSQGDRSAIERLRSCRGFIFDLDGTMVDSPLDFAFMRRELGSVYNVGSFSNDILLDVDGIEDAENKQQAIDMIRKIEIDAARHMTPIEGLFSIIQLLDQQGIKRALLTRNCKETVQLFNDLVLEPRGITPFHVAVSRDDMENLRKCKPDPAGIKMIWYVK